MLIACCKRFGNFYVFWTIYTTVRRLWEQVLARSKKDKVDSTPSYAKLQLTLLQTLGQRTKACSTKAAKQFQEGIPVQYRLFKRKNMSERPLLHIFYPHQRVAKKHQTQRNLDRVMFLISPEEIGVLSPHVQKCLGVDRIRDQCMDQWWSTVRVERHLDVS